jgi:hypothetical protein
LSGQVVIRCAANEFPAKIARESRTMNPFVVSFIRIPFSSNKIYKSYHGFSAAERFMLYQYIGNFRQNI